MAILVRCTGCACVMRTKDAFRGKRVQCPSCGLKLDAEGERVPDHEVFICHASKDKHVADAVCAGLEAKRIRCWIAPRDVLAGRTYGGALLDAIQDSRVLLVVVSKHSNASDHVLREIERAVAKGVPVLPFRIEDVALSSDLEYFLSASHWLDACSGAVESHIARLAGMIETLLARLDPARGGAPIPEAPSAVATAPPIAPQRAPARRGSRTPLALAAAGIVTVAAGALLALRGGDGKVEREDATEETARAQATPAPVDPGAVVLAADSAAATKLRAKAGRALDEGDLDAAEAAIAELERVAPDDPELGELRERLKRMRGDEIAAAAAVRELGAIDASSALGAALARIEVEWRSKASLRASSGLDGALVSARERLEQDRALRDRLDELEQRSDADFERLRAIETELAELEPALDAEEIRARIEERRAKNDARAAALVAAAGSASDAVAALVGLQAFAAPIDDRARVERLRSAAESALARIDGEIERAEAIDELVPLCEAFSASSAAPAGTTADALRGELERRRDALAERATALAREPASVSSAMNVLGLLERCLAHATEDAQRSRWIAAGDPALAFLEGSIPASVLDAPEIIEALSAEPPPSFAPAIERLRERVAEAAFAQGAASAPKAAERNAADLRDFAAKHASGSLRAKLEAAAGRIVSDAEASTLEKLEACEALAARRAYEQAKNDINPLFSGAPKGSSIWIRAGLVKAQIVCGEGESRGDGMKQKNAYLAAVDQLQALRTGAEPLVPHELRVQVLEEYVRCCGWLVKFFGSNRSSSSDQMAAKYKGLREHAQEELNRLRGK